MPTKTSAYKYSLIFLLLALTIFDQLFRGTAAARFWASIAGYLALLGIYKYSHLSLTDIGLQKSKLRPGAIMALKIAGAYLVVVIVIFLIHGQFFKDSRYHQGLARAVYAALVILPFKTVLFEELAFRGLLPALLLKISDRQRMLIYSALAFGAWHLTTAGGLRGGLNITGSSFLLSAGIFCLTAGAGYVFVYLRYKSDSLITPIILHWVVNGSAIILASLAWR